MKYANSRQWPITGRRLPGNHLAVLLILTLLIASSPAHAHEAETGEAEEAAPVRVLGHIDFPTSASSEQAQAAFIRGMLLLHLFEYDTARAEFLQAQEIEPDFAMAYWGEAMTWNHPIWDEQDLDAGRAALARLAVSSEQRLAAVPTPREQAFLASLDVLYGAGTKAERDRAYLRAIERMAGEYPQDHEVQLFYALALLGSRAGVRDIPVYMQATAIAESVFCKNPQHPGAAHYLIHGVDDPEHAVLGLEAARALAVMAPDAGHSLHMTSHIFTALGMWDDVVRANEAAIRVQNGMRAEQGLPERHWGHYNFWLLYGYLQQGRINLARDLLGSAYRELQEDGKFPEDRMILDPDRSQVGSVVQMWARYLIETRDWTGPVAEWNFKMGDAFDPNLTFSFVQAMRASAEGRASGVAQYLDQFKRTRSELEQAIRNQEEIAPSELEYLKRLSVLEQEMLAAVEAARGEYLAAAGFAAEASRLEGEMPYSFGPPYIDWPSAEMEGEFLLMGRKYADAVASFSLQLERARLRSNSLLGLARSQEKIGLEAEALYTAEKLAAIWKQADPQVRAALLEILPEAFQAPEETEKEAASETGAE